MTFGSISLMLSSQQPLKHPCRPQSSNKGKSGQTSAHQVISLKSSLSRAHIPRIRRLLQAIPSFHLATQNGQPERGYRVVSRLITASSGIQLKTLPSNDALRAHGILPPKPPSREPSPDIPHITHKDAIQAVAATAGADQLSTLLEADNLDSDDERMFEDYRRRRMEQMKQEERKGLYGSMEPLSREDFVREVTEGSKKRLDGEGMEPEGEEEDEDEDGDGVKSREKSLKGTGVVVFLFKDS